MKILMISRQFFPDGFGGGPHQTRSLADALTKKGIDVVFLGPEGGHEYLNENVEYHGIEWEGWINKFKAVLKIRSLINKKDIDLVHSQFAYPAGVLANKAMLGKKTPHIITSHGVDIRASGNSSYLSDHKKKVLVNLALKRAERHIVPSEHLSELAKKAGSSEEKLRIVPNILPEMDSIAEEEAQNIVKEKGIETEYMLSLSRLHPIKNLDGLIRAFSKLEDRQNLKLVIAGEGDIRKDLEKLAEDLDIEEDIIFTGYVEGKEKSAIYQQAKVFCLPSTSEAFGLTLLEAMNFQIPIAASDIGGISSVVEHGKEALLFDPVDTDDISEKIHELLENKDLRERIKHNQKESIKGYQSDTIAELHISLYSELVED